MFPARSLPKWRFPWTMFSGLDRVRIVVMLFGFFGLSPAASAPSYLCDPDVSLGGYSVTLINGDDLTSGVVPLGCAVKNPAIGVLEVTATEGKNALEIPLEAMTKSAGFRFETEEFTYLRLRLRADPNVTGSLAVEWTTKVHDTLTSGRAVIPHKSGAWVVHALDFTKVPEWKGELVALRLRLLDQANVGKSVQVDRIELVANDQTDELFGLEPMFMNVIQRMKTEGGGYRSVWEDIAKYSPKQGPENKALLDGRKYYFAKDPGKNRVAVYRYANKEKTSYLDSVEVPPAGYEKEELIGYIWTKCYTGMAPVIRAFNKATGTYALVDPTEKIEGFEPEATLGFAYARSEKPLQEYETKSDKMDDILYISSGKVRFGVNMDHGAAGWHWYHGDKQMVNISDFGRQMQLSYYFNGMNPSGVGFGRGQVGNPVAHVHVIGNQIVTRTVPIDWNFKNVTRIAGTISHPDMLSGMVLGIDTTFGILGHANLAKWTAYLHTPLAVTKGSQLEIMSNHPTADFTYRANIDFDDQGKLFVSKTKTDLKGDADEDKAAFYNYPKSNYGGNISALGEGDDKLCFGLMVGTYMNAERAPTRSLKFEFAGEKREGSSRHVNISSSPEIGPNYASPFDGHTTAQRSVMRTPTVAGDNRYVVYMMSGTIAEVKGYMQDLYDHRDHLEW